KWGGDCDSWIYCDSKNLSIKLELMPPNTREELHRHAKQEQFFFILNGTALFFKKGDSQVLHSQEGVFVAPNTSHYIANEGDEPLGFLVVSSPNKKGDRIAG
ncbi:cupin domain-containing protein, partial [Chitinophagales bacterium]|nr:cupin domain-containing protein [Chitinophagales bacterium]